MEAHRPSKAFKVKVKVNTTPQEDLAKILAGIREDYEAIIEKNRQDLENWFERQVTGQDIIVYNLKTNVLESLFCIYF